MPKVAWAGAGLGGVVAGARPPAASAAGAQVRPSATMASTIAAVARVAWRRSSRGGFMVWVGRSKKKKKRTKVGGRGGGRLDGRARGRALTRPSSAERLEGCDQPMVKVTVPA